MVAEAVAVDVVDTVAPVMVEEEVAAAEDADIENHPRVFLLASACPAARRASKRKQKTGVLKLLG